MKSFLRLVCILLLSSSLLNAGNVKVGNVRIDGMNQTTINRTLTFIAQNMDESCQAALPGEKEAILNLSSRRVVIAHGDVSEQYNALTSFLPNQNLTLILLNNDGPFFQEHPAGRPDQTFQDSLGLRGGSLQLQVVTLLHELGHALHIAGIHDDQNAASVVQRNNEYVQAHCGGLIALAATQR